MSKSLVFALLLAAGSLLSSAAQAGCTSIPYNLMNGHVADADDVNANFTYLGACAASSASPAFTGTPILSGSAPVFAFDGSTNANARGVSFRNNGTEFGAFTSQYTSGEMRLDSGTSVYAGLITFRNGTAGESGRFGTNGSFLVGTTTNGGATTVAKLAVVNGTTGQIAGSFQVTGGATSEAIDLWVENTSAYLAVFRYQGTFMGSISTNGTATAYNTTSDARLKSNVSDLSAYKSMRALRAYHPQEYLLRGKPGVGALAQDVDRRFSAAGLDAVQLGLVRRGDGDRALREGASGFRQWAMDSSKMVPFIIAAAVDHDDRLKRLEAENEVLKKSLRDLTQSVAVLQQGRNAERQAAASASRRTAR